MATTIPPVLLPESPNANDQRYGLFEVANGPLDLPPHAGAGGLVYQTSLCQVPYGYTVKCVPDAKTLTHQLGTVTGTPFVVVADTLCGTLGHNEAEWVNYVTDRLTAGEQLIVENIFGTGVFGEGPSLANNNPNATLLPIATNISGGIDALEAWLYAQYGPTGILHIPIMANSAVYSDFHIFRDTGGIMRTPMGTKVSFGNYGNLLPDGTAPTAGNAVFYITGQMSIWRAPDIFVSPYGPSIDKTTNQIKMFAEREYVMAYDCFVAGIQVPLVSP
jgi:hypothetical protein